MINESHIESAMIDWLQDLGYTYVYGAVLSPGGEACVRLDYSEVILKERLYQSLRKINAYALEEIIEEAMRRVLFLPHPSLLLNNHEFHRFITHGIDIQVHQDDGSFRTEKVWLFDRKVLSNNDWLVVNQFAVQEGKAKRRPDVIIYVNGLPLVVIELKNAATETATVDSAWNQLQTYKYDIPSLMAYTSFFVISDGIVAKAGSLTASMDRFTYWRSDDGIHEAPKSVPQLETLTYGMLNKETLLDIIHNFVMFQSDGINTWKVLAAYQQYYAVNKAVENAHRATSESGDRRIGVIWHTTGSGKSFTMTFFTGKLIRQMKNPTIVVITDRNDLDDQLYTTFSRSAELLNQTPEQAMSRAELRQKLQQRNSGGIIFTTIQKFTPDNEDTMPLLNDRSNIIVIADEAHRSQYGFEARVVRSEDEATIKYGYARYLHEALPNASYIGFTGTPIEKKDANTPAVFGDYIDIYDMSRSIDDQTTVPIYYESRLAQLNLPEDLKPKIDESFEDITEQQETDIKEQKKSEWSRLEKLVGSAQRIEQVASDMVRHFESRQEAIWGKAMVVCMSRRICVDLYAAITRLRPEWHSDDDNKGRIKVVMTGSAADPESYRPHVCTDLRKKTLASRMKNAGDELEIVIVRDMWFIMIPRLKTQKLEK